MTVAAAAELKALGAGRFQVTGELGFDTVKPLLVASEAQFAAESQLDIDLAGVTHGDSAGLALLIEWLRRARQAGKALRYTGMPGQLRALARISDVEEVLPLDA